MMRARAGDPNVTSRKRTAEQYARELAQLYREHGGLNPEIVIAWARDNPKSALHGRFEWDDTKAAHAYRLIQARNLITSVTVVTSSGETRPIYVSPVEQRGGEGYAPLVEIISDEERRRRFLRQAVREYQSIGQKYMDLVELDGVRAELDRIAEMIGDDEEEET